MGFWKVFIYYISIIPVFCQAKSLTSDDWLTFGSGRGCLPCSAMHFLIHWTFFLKVKLCHYSLITCWPHHTAKRDARAHARMHTHTHALRWPSRLSSTQWWDDGGAGQTPLRRHLHRQLQPLPQTDGREEVSQLGPHGEEKVRVSRRCPAVTISAREQRRSQCWLFKNKIRIDFKLEIQRLRFQQWDVAVFMHFRHFLDLKSPLIYFFVNLYCLFKHLFSIEKHLM